MFELSLNMLPLTIYTGTTLQYIPQLRYLDIGPRSFRVCPLSRTLCSTFIFKVVIIRYDKLACDRERVHMIITRAEASPDRT